MANHPANSGAATTRALEYGVTLEGWLQRIASQLRLVAHVQTNPLMAEMFIGFARDVDTAIEIAHKESSK